MLIIFISFLAGIVTVASPCVLPVLPVVLGSSIAGEGKYRPYFVCLGLALAVTAFTLLLKSSVACANISPDVLRYISAALVALVGISFLFPDLWTAISEKIGFDSASQKGITGAGERSGILGALLSGMALGPVFASCSPVYAILISTVLTSDDISQGALAVGAYSIGLSLALLLIALLGRSAVKKMGFLAKRDGYFRKTVGILLLVMAILIALDLTLQLQVAFTELWPGLTTLEMKLADMIPLE